MSEIGRYRILGRQGEPQRIDGSNRSVGDVVEMTPEAAEFYLREGRIEPVGDKTGRGRAADKPAATDAG